ncbi:hypothetical protein [Nocardia sp. XZ_19_385]|uniref:hypothetical protein n=1 Tax=Nocardia sp. XZ_19_385 TaxID=2769488 RepID=UPI0018900C6B|nr:hypothetical protein [Nocardia sp. XZ_19_385]
MSDIEYVFGTGAGEVHVWSSPADLELARTGTVDAVQLDFDGDGLFDDALWDTHGAGVADVAALDLNDDGVLDHFYTDPSGLGTWNHLVTGFDSANEPLEWTIRPEPEPALEPAPDNVMTADLAQVLAEYPVLPHDSLRTPRDFELLDQTEASWPNE